MATNNVDLFSYLPGIEVSENELLESELATQQILKAKFPTLDLREGTALRDLAIRPNATLLGLINKALVFYFSNNTISEVTDETPQSFVDKLMSNWFLTRKAGIKTVINARMFFAKSKSVSMFSDVFFSPDGVLKYFPVTSSTYAPTQLSFDSSANQYYIDVDLVAEAAGTEYNITTGSLLYFTNFDPYFLHAEINYIRQTAENIETNSQFINRAKTAISTRNNINIPSIDANLREQFNFVSETKTVGFGDPEMTRDQIKVLVPGVVDPVWIHNGGNVDIYCRVPAASSIVQLTTDANGKVNITGSVYKVERSLISGGAADDTVPLYTTQPITGLTRTGTVATATCVDHGYSTGDSIMIQGALQSGYNGLKVITVVDMNIFTFTIADTVTTPASGTITAGIPSTFVATNANLLTAAITSVTRTDSLATVAYTNHGLMIADRVQISGAVQPEYNGIFEITAIPDRDTFQYVVTGTPVSPATGTVSATFVDRTLDVGFSDRQTLSVDFGASNANKTASFTIYYQQGIDSVQSYLENPTNRVLCGDLIARGFNLTMLDITVTAYNGPSPDAEICNEIVIEYLNSLGAGEVFVMSDLLAQLYAAGITTIKTPLDITYTKYWNDLLGTTSGTITDVLDPNDTCNIFVVNSLTTTNLSFA